jgi:hypothetical protein
MTPVLVALFMTALLVFALWGGLALVKLRETRYAAYAAAANEFYVAADRLVDNPDCPKNVLEFLEDMNELINFPRTAMYLAQSMRKNKHRPKSGNVISLRKMPQGIVADFVIACNSWVDAVSYRTMFWGLMFRIYLDMDLGSLERASAITADQIAGRPATNAV